MFSMLWLLASCQEPELLEVAPGQKVRCFYPEKEVRCSEEHRKALVNKKS